MRARLFRQAALLPIIALAMMTPAVGQLPTTIIRFEKPLFPPELKGTFTDGFSTVAFTVSADGRIDDAVVLEASHQAFGESVLQVIPAWQFESVDAAALPRREVLRIDFRLTNAITTVSHRDAAKAAFPLTLDERLPVRTVAWTALSTPPERVVTQSPSIKTTQGGRVAVSYVIDTQGKVRVPAVVDTTRPDLALAALEAVKHWQFAPPQFEGKPVLVEDTRAFTFGR